MSMTYTANYESKLHLSWLDSGYVLPLSKSVDHSKLWSPGTGNSQINAMPGVKLGSVVSGTPATLNLYTSLQAVGLPTTAALKIFSLRNTATASSILTLSGSWAESAELDTYALSPGDTLFLQWPAGFTLGYEINDELTLTCSAGTGTYEMIIAGCVS